MSRLRKQIAGLDRSRHSLRRSGFRIGPTDVLWVVTEATASTEELSEICYQTDLRSLALEIRGGHDVLRYKTTLYADEATARADAVKRMATKTLERF